MTYKEALERLVVLFPGEAIAMQVDTMRYPEDGTFRVTYKAYASEPPTWGIEARTPDGAIANLLTERAMGKNDSVPENPGSGIVED